MYNINEFFIIDMPIVKGNRKFYATFLFYSEGGFIPLVKEKLVRMNKFSSFEKYLEYCDLHNIKIVTTCDNKKLDKIIHWKVRKRNNLEMDESAFNFFIENIERIVEESDMDFVKILGIYRERLVFVL